MRLAADYWHHFPDNQRVYPKELGQRIRFITYDEPEVRYDGEEDE